MLKKDSTKILLLVTLCSIVLFICPSLTMAQQTGFYVDPPSIAGLEIGNTFQVNITVSDVVDLWAWEFRMYYKNSVLNITSAVEGPFLRTHPNPNATTLFGIADDSSETYNATLGLLHLYDTIIGSGVTGGVNGTGTLAVISFKVVGEGECPLVLSDTLLVDSAAPFGNRISHTTTSGVVHVGLHDVAITNTKTSKTITSDVVYINVTAENQGKNAENFTLTAYYNSTAIETKTITNLQAGSSIVTTFTWNTSSVPKGNYSITAVASTVPGETDTADNTHVDGWVQRAMPGDLSGDGKVNILDVSKVARIFLVAEGGPGWDPNCDMDNNGVINIVDITRVAKEFGKVDP
jgi:hypothetical protein